MANTTRSSSPDPITLPSSPLSGRSPKKLQLPPRRPSSVRASPNKSIILDTGRDGTVSPWRIKVTVQAEPREGTASPKRPRRRGTRATPAPLNDIADESSPIRAGYGTVSRENVQDRPERKRKGTPIRQRRKRAQIGQEPATDEGDAAGVMPSPEQAPTSSATKARRRRGLNAMPTERSQLLSRARDELDQALQDAVGYDDVGYEDEMLSMPGDMTVAGNEDFTMVSVETLQSMKADTSLISNRMEVNKTTVSVSYLPSSPPKTDRETAPSVEYPDLTAAVEKVRSTPAVNHVSTASPHSQQEGTSMTGEMGERRRARKVASQYIEEANAGQAIVTKNDTVTRVEPGKPQRGTNEPGDDADIWQEEASRSFEDESRHRESRRSSRRTRPRKEQKTLSQDLNDLFSGTNRPSRAKIPRTWRRVSGADFTYSDSPAHDLLREGAAAGPDASADDVGSQASSDVLTPPSSGDEQGSNAARRQPDQHDNSFTRPDAEGTQLQAGVYPQDEENREPGAVHNTSRSDLATPLSDSSSSATSPDADDTGLFWQNNLPQVYTKRDARPRPKQMRPMDLSELLDLHDKTQQTREVAVAEGSVATTQTGAINGSPIATFNTRSRDQPRESRLDSRAYSPLRMRPFEGRIKSTPSETSQSKVVSSPLRKSLLRSSKLPGSPIRNHTVSRPIDEESSEGDEQAPTAQDAPEVEDLTEDVNESFPSKFSDQRQLLREQQHTLPQHRGRVEYYETEQSRELEDFQSSVYGDNETVEEPSRSYEERLNLDSPQKINVNFNDSEGNYSLLHRAKEYPPLFVSTTKQAQSSSPTFSVVAKKPDSTPEGLLSRLTSSFWSAVVRPTGPTEVFPAYVTHIPDDVGFSPSLRVEFRSRYGVLSSTHPWTKSHMWTLHRMHNSCTSGKYDSIVPRSGPLPSFLSARVDTTQTSIAGYKWHFTSQHAHVVHSFMQILVDVSIVEAMERGEVEFLGDWLAKEHRGEIKGAKANGPAWAKPGMGILKKGLKIEMDFVLAALGDVILEELRAQERKWKQNEVETIER